MLGNNLCPRTQPCRTGLSQLVASCLHVHKHLAFGLRGDTLGNGARIHVAELGAVHNPLTHRTRRRHANRNRAVETAAALKMRLFDMPAPRQHHLRECLAARGIACGMKLKVTDVRRIRRGRVTRRRRDADSLYQRIGRRVHARVGAFVRIVIGSRPICRPHGARVAHNALKSDAASRAKSYRHAGDPRQLRPTRWAESQLTHPVHP